MSLSIFLAKKLSIYSNRSFSKTVIGLSLIATSLSISIILISDAVVVGFKSEIKTKIISFASHIQISNTANYSSIDAKPIAKTKPLLDSIQHPKIKNMYGYANKACIIKSETEVEGLILKGVDNGYKKENIQTSIVEEIPNFNLPNNNQILLSNNIVKKLNAHLGDTLNVYFVQEKPSLRRLQIAAIFETHVEEVDQSFGICNIETIQQQNYWDSLTVGGIEIFIDDIKDIDEVVNDLKFNIPLSLDAKSVFARYPQVFDWLNLLDTNVYIIFILLSLVAAINMITALIILIIEKKSHIAILRTLGTPVSTISKSFLYSTLIITIIGIFIGNILAFSIIIVQQNFGIFKLDPASYYIREVPMFIVPSHIIFINVLAFLICFLSMIIPGFLVVRTNITKALKQS